MWQSLVQVKKVTHKLPEKNFAYGINKPRQAEGAREVSMMWVAHKGNPDAKPGPDFMAMNKLAAGTCKKASEVRAFREDNDVRLKKINPASQAKDKHRVRLPSDGNPNYTFGRASANRTIEEERMFGDAPNIKHIVQGTFMNDWMTFNNERKETFIAEHAKIEPKATKATQGHADGAAKAKAQRGAAAAPFKMKKFATVKSKLAQQGTFGPATIAAAGAMPADEVPAVEA